MKKRVKTAKDIKIDEIIKLAGQVNSNNKKFLNTNDKYTKKQREKELDKYFKNFQREIVRDRNTVNIANDFHTWVERKDKDGKVMRDRKGNVIIDYNLNITKSKVFYRQISDKNLDILLDSLRDLQYGRKAKKGDKNTYEVTINGKTETRVRNKTKTYTGWKKQDDSFKKGFIENTIKDFKRSYNSAYKELRKLGYDDEDIAHSMKSLIEENDYSNSDQLIDDVAKKYDVYDKLLEKAYHASQF